MFHAEKESIPLKPFTHVTSHRVISFNYWWGGRNFSVLVPVLLSILLYVFTVRPLRILGIGGKVRGDEEKLFFVFVPFGRLNERCLDFVLIGISIIMSSSGDKETLNWLNEYCHLLCLRSLSLFYNGLNVLFFTRLLPRGMFYKQILFCSRVCWPINSIELGIAARSFQRTFDYIENLFDSQGSWRDLSYILLTRESIIIPTI